MQIHIFTIAILLICCLQTNSFINPLQFSEKLISILPKQVTLLHFDLGRTANGYNIIAYGLTAIPGIPPKYELRDFAYYPSSVIIAYMHSSDFSTVDFLYGYAAHIMSSYGSDYYVQTVLKTGIVWLVPYLSIDAYELTTKKSRGVMQSTQGQQKQHQHNLPFPYKNMNKYPNKNQQNNCKSQNGNLDSGVDINFNFLQQDGDQFSDVCNPNYAGPQPFSEVQAKALKNLFDTLTVTVTIDLQLGSNQWILPSQHLWHEKHKYSYLYSDIVSKINTKSHYKLVQEKVSLSNNKNSVATGGFINWACLQGSLALKYAIPSEYKSQKDIQQAFAVVDLLVKKNAPLYNKYLSDDKQTLYVQSICLNQFTVQLQIIIEFGQTVTKNYQIPRGQIVAISLKAPSYPAQSSLSNGYRPQPKYHMYVLNSLIAEVLDVERIISVETLPPELLLAVKNLPSANKSQARTTNIITFQIIVAISTLAAAGILVLIISCMMSKKKLYHKAYHQISNNELIDSKF